MSGARPTGRAPLNRLSHGRPALLNNAHTAVTLGEHYSIDAAIDELLYFVRTFVPVQHRGCDYARCQHVDLRILLSRLYVGHFLQSRVLALKRISRRYELAIVR